MGILRRIQLFIVRNSSKNIVIFMLLMFITVFVLTLVSTVEGVQNAGASLKKDIQASFRIQGNYIENIQDGIFETYPIDKSIAEMISSYEEIAAYNITQRTEYVAEDLILPSGQLQGELIGNTDTGLSNDFRKNTVTLIKGKCVFEDGKCEAVISKEFAEENELDIDDSLNLKNLDGESSIVFKVIGIYEAGQNDEFNTDTIFTSNEVIWNMYYAGEFEKIHGSVTFFISDPGAIENIILEIKDNIPIDWNQYVINTDKGNYNKVSYQLQSIEKLSIILTVIPFWMVMTGAASPAVILGTILAMAVVQVLVHLVCFLHMNTKSDEGWNMTAFVFTVLIIAILVVGSIWIMWNLNYNMMMH